jgi:NAD(P)-dependent dehydrogenase (short-subunit alcohol dehydrogenase family)
VPQPVIIFGASGGLGRAIALRLAGGGWPLVLSGRDPARLAALAAETGGEAQPCDATQEGEVQRLFADVEARHGTLAGVVVSIATPFQNRLAHRTPIAAFSEQMHGQLDALHFIAASAFPLLSRAEGTSRLIVVSSEFALGAPPVKTAPYSAAKAAMTAYAGVIAQEWLKHSIRVHILAPGMVRTNLVASMPDVFLDQLAEATPEKMLTRAEDVADMAAFCMTDAADPLYGTPIRVSRGPRR